MKRSLIIAFLLLLLCFSVKSIADTKAQDMSHIRIQNDFNNAIDASYKCSDNEDFDCATANLNKAHRLIDNEKSKYQLSDAIAYREQQRQFYLKKKVLSERLVLVEECARECPIPTEYYHCIKEGLESNSCNKEEQYTGNDYQSSKSLQTSNTPLDQSFIQQIQDRQSKLEQRKLDLAISQQQLMEQLQLKINQLRQQQTLARQWADKKRREEERRQREAAQKSELLVQ